MSRHIVSENLRHLMKLHEGISILELSKKTQIPQPTLHHILSGQTKKPRVQVLKALANFFYISVNQLMGLSPLPQIPKALKENLKISAVPIIEWNMLCANFPEKLDSTEFKEIILEREVNQNSFALIMNNTHMEPLFPEKSLLIFEARKQPKDRDFALIALPEKNEILFNRLFIDGAEFYLKQNQNNSGFLKLTFPSDKILAILIEVRLQF